MSRRMAEGLPQAFYEEYWLKKPVVLRNLFSDVPASAGEIFEALRSYPRSDIEEKAGQLNSRLYLNSAIHTVRDPAFQPNAGDGSMRTYLERLARETNSPDYGLIVNNFQALDARIWQRYSRFAGAVYRKTGIPCGGAMVDLFCGNYVATPFRFHKDAQDVFTFVIEGRKRFLVWPFGLKDAPSDEDSVWRSTSIPGLDYESIRHEAITLEAGVGDVIYWPASYWHVAESDGDFSMTLPIGFFVHHPVRNRFLADSIDAIMPVKETNAGQFEWYAHFDESTQTDASGAERLANEQLETLRDNSRRIQVELQSNWLCWMTRHGFPSAPPPVERAALKDEDVIQSAVPHPALFFAVDEMWIRVCAAGRAFTLPRDSSLLDLIRIVNAGEPIAVRRAIDASLARSGAARKSATAASESGLGKFLNLLYSLSTIKVVRNT